MSLFTLAHAPALRGRARRGLLGGMLTAVSLRRQRARLAHLDPHLLRDIGLTAEQAAAEAARPVWDVPPHWRG